MWFNSPIAAILRSPLHGLMSGSVMLMTVTGRKSGTAYTTPVNYLSIGDELWTVSFRNRTWWRNLRGGAAVSLRLRGRVVQTTAQAVEPQAEVAQALAKLVEVSPGYARNLGIRRTPDGRADPSTLQDAARDRVIVRVRAA
jgi:deazaflavin-dependent oxidoreductase (nitroreductase family)